VAKGQFVMAIQIVQLSCPLITNFEVTINAYYLSDTDFKEMLKSEGSATFALPHMPEAVTGLSSDGVWGPRVPADSAILAAGLI
jgi:hypothetical protein